MEKLIATFFTFLFLNSVSAADINESNFLEFLSKKNFITAEFIQTTFNNVQ